MYPSHPCFDLAFFFIAQYDYFVIMLQHVSIILYFIFLSSITLYGYTTVCCPSTFTYWWAVFFPALAFTDQVVMKNSAHVFIWICGFIHLKCWERNSWVIGRCMFKFLRNGQFFRRLDHFTFLLAVCSVEFQLFCILVNTWWDQPFLY